MTTNALLIDLDPLYSDPLPPPPAIISSATLAILHPAEHTGEELARLRRELNAANNEIDTLEDELKEAVAALRDARAESARLDRARRWEIEIRETKEKELVELKKRMEVTRGGDDTTEAPDPTGSKEEGSQQRAEAEYQGRTASLTPSPTTHDIGLKTDSPVQETSTSLVPDTQTSESILQSPDACIQP
jgi:uncharacterized membrane protein